MPSDDEDGAGGGSSGPDPTPTTEFSASPPALGLVPRPRLLEKLARCVRHRLTVVCGPVGSGKTTLLSEWQASPGARAHSITRLSLGSMDDGAARWFREVAAMAGGSMPGQDRGVLPPVCEPLPALPEPGREDLHRPSSPISSERVLVLDDYHLIRSRSVHEALAAAVERLPLHVHLVVSSRTLPRLPLARLRARGEVLEIRGADLRFTVEESTAFLEGTAGLRLSPGEAEALAASTEGWAAGLHLAAALVRERAGPASIPTFTGSHRLVVDFFREEVLSRQPPDVQDFLLRTSVLQRLNGPLCDAVMALDRAGAPRRRRTSAKTGIAWSQRMLERLDSENLFLVPLDEERRFWRYHRLFAEFLRRELEEARPGELPELHRRAAGWLEENGFTAEAARHAIAVQDFERAARLVQAAWRSCSAPSTVLLPLVQALPDSLLQSRPRLRLIEAWALLGTGQIEAATAWLDSLALASPRDRLLLAEADALRAFVASLRGDPRRTIRLLSNGLRRLARGSTSTRAIMHLSLGMAHESLGDAAGAHGHYDRSRRLSDKAGAGVSPFVATFRLGNMELRRGSLGEAARLFEMARCLASRVGWPHFAWPGLGWPHVGLARISYEWNDLDSAARDLDAAIERSSGSPLADVPVVAYALLAHVRQSQGALKAANRLAARSRELMAGPISSPALSAIADAFQTRLWLRQGDLDPAVRWAEARSGPPCAVWPDDRHVVNTTWARVMVATGDARSTVAHLSRWLDAARRSGEMGLAIELEMLLALGLAAAGDPEGARSAIERVLARARPEGFFRLFLDEGEPMARLLEHATRGRSATSAHARGLLAGFERRAGPSVSSTAPEHTQDRLLLEPLRKREGEILSLIGDGLSNPEIAERLLVTVATVKTHINNLYAKLGARSRTDALARARRLGIV